MQDRFSYSAAGIAALISFLAAISVAHAAVPRITRVTINAVDVSARAITVTDSAGERLTLKLTATTKITIDRESVGLDAFKPDQEITITFDPATKIASRLTGRTSQSSSTPRPTRTTKPAAKPAVPKDDAKESAKETSKRPVPRTSAGESAAGQWPRWRGPTQDGISTETGLLVPWPRQGLREIWSAPVGEGYSGVAVAGGRVYTMDMRGGRENVLCFNAPTGKQEWTHGYAGAYENNFGSGPRGTPTVDGERVYTLGAMGHLHCLNARTGDVVWARDLLGDFRARNIQWGISASPLVEGDYVYVNPGGPNGNSIAALDKKSGRTVWSAFDDQAGYATPLRITVGRTQAIVFFTAVGLIGVDPDRGTGLFRYRWTTQYDCNIATPIFADDKLFISSNYGAGCALVQLTATGRGIDVSPIYTNKVMKNHFSTCVLVDGNLYGFSDAILTCMEFASGTASWRERGLGKGSLTAADGHLIILSESGKLVLARATPDRFDEVSSFQALSGKCWTVPVVAGGRLFVRNEQTLKCYDLKSQ